ncbi:MAG TPA: cupin domain-containing protein [Alphaproteobacteria bacterium]
MSQTTAEPAAKTAEPRLSWKRAELATKAFFFKLRAQLLDQGRTDTEVCRTDNMWARLKVYASGGENALHCHPREDHMFVILQGSACFFDKDGGTTNVNKHEGILLPAGTFYSFEATSKEPLVLIRVGSRTSPANPQGRLNIKGEPMAGDSAENKTAPIVFREDAFFE